MNILVAEDDKDIAHGLKELLAYLGHTVDHVENGIHAYERLATGHQYDALLLDLMMPLMTGLEFLVKARHEGLITCPVIFSTGYDPAWAKDVAGVDYLLPKPVEERELRVVLDQVEAKRHSVPPSGE